VANTKSAQKQNRQMIKRRARNAAASSALKTEVRKFRETLEGGDAAKTGADLKKAIKAIAKAGSKGLIHKSQAARRISRLSKAAHAKAAPAAK
jgi:small subunit ribosomal protein S20